MQLFPYAITKICNEVVVMGVISLTVLMSTSCYHQNKPEDVFVVATYDDVKDWDPGTAFSLEVLPMSNIYEPLLWYDAGSVPPKLLPALATSYSKSADGLTWEFYLRERVWFHDGSAFDSKAVKFVVDRNKRLNG